MLKLMHQALSIALSIIAVAVSAEDSLCSQEIRVHLATSSPLSPVYLSHLEATQSAFSPTYLNELQAILQYDLNYNGSTKVLPRSQEKEQLVQTASAQMWKNLGANVVIKWSISGKTLQATAFAAQTGSLKQFSDIPLTGDLSHDRRQIHKLADGIHKALFHSESVAHSRILFSYQVKNPRSDGSEWISEIWECDWDGANARQVTHDNSYSVTPVLVPKSSQYANDRFLYVSYKNGQPKIYIASLKEGSGKRLIPLGGNQLLPTVSPQRDKIAFICDAAGRTDLFLQPLQPETGQMGKPVQLYSYPRSTQASPTFSPDGKKLAFASDKDGGIRIYVIPTTSTGSRPEAQMISKQNRENSCPCWSPDGTKLAYSAKTNGIRQIWIYDFDSGDEWQLTAGPGNKENPCWAPDSKHIVFNSTDNSTSELYVVNLNQPDAIKITRGPGKKHYPSWGTR